MRRVLGCGGLAAVIGLAMLLEYGWIGTGLSTTVTRLSPDETLRARLEEHSPTWGMDRNFAIRLEYLAEGKSERIYGSPDEGRPAGTERLIWSKDGAWLLLVSRHCYVKEDLFLDNGDQLYFLYHLPTRRAWCNAEMSSLPPIKAEQVRAIEFTEPVRLKGE